MSGCVTFQSEAPMPGPPLMAVMRIITINSCTIHIFTAEASTLRKSRDKPDLKIAPSSVYDAKDPDLDFSSICFYGENQISSPLQNLLAAYLCPLGRIRNTNEAGCFALFPNSPHRRRMSRCSLKQDRSARLEGQGR